MLKSQKEEDRLKKSKVIQKKLFLTQEFKRAKTILFYASFNGEVETFRMIRQALRLGKKIALPLIQKRPKKIIPVLVQNLRTELTKGAHGICEPRLLDAKPLDVREIDLAIIPGVAFDCKNNRLGRGAGYYDRFLRDFPITTPTIGLAFDFQVVNALPFDKAHDVPVARVIAN